MRKCVLALMLVIGMPCAAHAVPKWTKAAGTVYLTDYSTTSGLTLDNYPGSRQMSINMDIRTRGNRQSRKTTCRDNRADQRICKAFYYAFISNESCGVDVKTVFSNISVTKRKKYMFQESTISCPSGWMSYALWEGFVIVR